MANPNILCSSAFAAELFLGAADESGVMLAPALWGREKVQQGPAVFRNQLLVRLSLADRRRIAPHLTLVTLDRGISLVTPGKTIERCYFFESGVASVISSNADGKQAEIGIIGREGVVDVAILMGGTSSPLEVFVQMPGQAYTIAAAELSAMLDESRDLRRLLFGFAHSFLIQVSHTALATVTLNIEDRLARWLLMSCDRSESDTFPVTHELLSLMLGVRRAGVTDALNKLAAVGLISTTRGQITILDRAALEKRAGDSYGIPEANYRELVGI